MKSWKPLLALACLALAAAPAFATGGSPGSVLFKGLYYAPQGSCTVDALTDGLLLSNIGSSGNDGVSIDCLHMDGMRLALAGDCDDTDEGAHATFTYHWRLLSQPAQSRATSMSWSVGQGFADCTPDCSSLSSSSTQRVTFTLGGVVRHTMFLPSGTPVRATMDATGACPNPTLSCSVTRPAEGTVRWHGAAAFSRVVHLSVAGHDEDCDGVEFSCAVDPDDDDCDGVSCDLRVSSPPGSHFGQVLCPSAECRTFGHFVRGADATEVSVLPSAGVTGKKLYVGNLPFSVQGGLEVVRAPEECDDGDAVVGSSSSRFSASVACAFAPPSLSFSSPADVGASIALTLTGTAFSSTGTASPATVSCKVSRAGDTMTGLVVECDHSSLGATLQTVDVMQAGTLVERITVLPGASIQVLGTPGGPPFSPIVSLGRHHELQGNVTLIRTPMFATNGADQAALSSSSSSSSLAVPMEVMFASSRAFIVDNHPPVIGDELVMSGGSDSPGGYSGSFVVVVSSLSVRSPSPGGSLSPVALLDLADVGHDEIFADVPPSTGISSAHPCVTIPFVFARTDSTPVRGYSVRFHLSPELAQCGAGVVEGDYLSSVGGTHMFVTDNGGGSYTVDCGILGPVCGATGNGRLFSVALGAVMPPASDVGAVTVDAVVVRDCSNAPVPASAGSSGLIPIQFGAPPSITGLTATQVKTGNPPGERTSILVVWPALSSVGSSVVVFHKGFGNYPLYDNGAAPGAVPSPPASSSAALASGWTQVTCGAGSCGTTACPGTCDATSVVDSEQTRDWLYHVAFVRDLYGNESPVSNMTTGTLDYHLGDVSNGLAMCTGDNHVSLVDISALGAHYGASVSPADAWTCLDVGPTTDFSVDGRPVTDGRIEFEDFMMFAINYGLVSAPALANRPAAAPLNASQLVVPALPAPGGTFDAGVIVDGAGDVQGMSIRLAYDANVLEQVGVSPGALLEQQGRPGTVLSSGPGVVDAALLGVGPGLAGHGEIARVTFRVKAAGEPNLAIARLEARDAANRAVAIAGAAAGAALPGRTALGFAYPNPFRESVALQLSLHRAGPAAIGIYDVAGRRVRTLVRGIQPAGSRVVTWDGRDDAGIRLAPGAYIVRLETAGRNEARTVRLVR